MDPNRFDVLTTFLATRPTRRQVLRALTGLAGGGLAPLATIESAGAFICRAGGVLCATGKQCCSGSCVDHYCTCAYPGQVLCHGRCADCCGDGDCAANFSCQEGNCVRTCFPATNCPGGQSCGTADDGCGGQIACGDCDASLCQSCGNGQCVVCGGDANQVCCDGSCIPADGCCTDDQCGDLADQCHVGACEDHDCVAKLQLGAVCDDGDACTSGATCRADGNCGGGTPVDCDDGLDCTIDFCDHINGCVHMLRDDTCQIAGACYKTGVLNPDNPCAVCDPDTSQSDWSNVAAETVCGAASCDGTTYSPQATCDGQGRCQQASPISCTAELSCETAMCDPKIGCEVTINPGYCVVLAADHSMICVTAGTVVENVCLQCRPDITQIGWSIAPEGTRCANGFGSCDGVHGTCIV